MSEDKRIIAFSGTFASTGKKFTVYFNEEITMTESVNIKLVNALEIQQKHGEYSDKYRKGYNDAIDDFSQYEIDVKKFAELLSLSFDDVELKDKYGIERAFHIQQATYLASNAKMFIVKKEK